MGRLPVLGHARPVLRRARIGCAAAAARRGRASRLLQLRLLRRLRRASSGWTESHIALRLRFMARRARMRPNRTIALTVMPASASAAAITSISFCNEAVGLAGSAASGASAPCSAAGCCTCSTGGCCSVAGTAAAIRTAADFARGARGGRRSFHRIDDSGAGVSTFGMAARGFRHCGGCGYRSLALAGGFGSARALAADDPFGARVGDRLARDRSLLWRRRLLRRGWCRGEAVGARARTCRRRCRLPRGDTSIGVG